MNIPQFDFNNKTGGKSGSKKSQHFTFPNWKSNKIRGLCRVLKWVMIDVICKRDDNEIKLDDIKQISCTDDNGYIDFLSYTLQDFERWSKRRRLNTLISLRGDQLHKYWELVKEPFRCFANVDRETANGLLADYYAHIPTNDLRLSNHLSDAEFWIEFEEIANKYQVFPIPVDYNMEEQINVHVKDLSALVSMHVGLVSRVMGTDAANTTDDIQIFSHLFLSKYHQLV